MDSGARIVIRPPTLVPVASLFEVSQSCDFRVDRTFPLKMLQTSSDPEWREVFNMKKIFIFNVMFVRLLFVLYVIQRRKQRSMSLTLVTGVIIQLFSASGVYIFREQV